MGRKAGVSAAQTRAELLAAAAQVFADKGYDGASISDITAAAKLSSGAIYSHYAGKAELFMAVVREHGQAQFRNVVGHLSEEARRSPSVGLADFLTVAGSSYARADAGDSSLLVEAIVASRRHPEIAEMIGAWMAEGEAQLRAALAAGQEAGTIRGAFAPDAAARFLTMVGLGARLASASRLDPVDGGDWDQFIELLVDTLRSQPDRTDAVVTS